MMVKQKESKELEVIDMGKSDEGFAADYAGVYHVMKINKITVK